MNRSAYRIFSEGSIAGTKIKNRLVRSATYEAAMTREGRITQRMLDLYRDLARGGVGLIITGHMAVAREGRANSRQSCLYGDGFIKEIKPIADIVHEAGDGVKVFAQLSHAGRQITRDNREAEAVGPSDVPSPVLKKRARPLREPEIRSIVESFADAAARAKEAGFDGVQLHAAHGWLLSSFLSPYTNRRDDGYGGSLDNRIRIIDEIVKAARQRIGKYPIIIKLNCEDHVEGGIGFDSFPETAKAIERTGVDAIEVSGGMWDCLARSRAELGFAPLPIPEARTGLQRPESQSYFLRYANEAAVAVPLMLVGGNRNVEAMEEILRGGKIDFLSMSRPLINDPDLPNRWCDGIGSDTAGCASCNSCLFMVRTSSLACLLNQSRMMQKLVKNATPVSWKMFLR